MNVSEYIFDFFYKKSVDTVFMVTGGQAMYLNDAVGKHGGYTIICNHHEQAATMSADAYGRIKNKPAIALVTAGPGAINAINGVVGGYTDSSPMIVISGHTNLPFVQYQNSHNIRQFGIQGINIGPLVKSVVKYFVSIDNLLNLKYELQKAFFVATSGRPGPVWIEVPLDLQSSQVPEYQKEYNEIEPFNNDNDLNKSIGYVIEKLTQAKRPILLVGQGISLAGAREIFRKVANKIQIPVVTARLGIDLIESDNRLYVGRPGNYGERSANFAIQNSDLVISIGCRLASSTVGHSPKMFAKNACLIVIDIDEEELKKPGPNINYSVLCDCKMFLEKLSKSLENYTLGNFSEWVECCNHWKQKYPVVQDEYKTEQPINSYHFTDRLSYFTDANTMVMVDTGSCFHVACQTWKVKLGQHYLTTGGISSMGYWCAGIGACIANDKKNTVVITGDGSLQMNIQEFAVIKHNNLPIKVFVFNNNGYLLIRHTQRNFMQDRFVGESPATGVWCPDSMKIAEAYGIRGIKISKLEEIDSKIKEVLAHDGPVICEVMTQEWQMLVPRISSEKMPDGKLVAHDYEDMYPFLSRDELKENMVVSKE